LPTTHDLRSTDTCHMTKHLHTRIRVVLVPLLGNGILP
jgi:hypothetical protein